MTKALSILLGMILALGAVVYAAEPAPLKLELTGIIVPAKPSKTLRAACVLNDRILYRGDMVELLHGKLGAKVVPSTRVKVNYPVMVVYSIGKGGVVVVVVDSDKDGDGRMIVVKMKKRTQYGLEKVKDEKGNSRR